MTHDEINSTEDALVQLATLDAHLEAAVVFLQHGQRRAAIEELKAARQCNLKVKLLVMAYRWMDVPDTLRKLYRKQTEWMEKRLSEKLS
jgi:cellulose synthase/poly-beta-1,6-N-acetylglucosamine synthase-like glycosyltransferase